MRIKIKTKRNLTRRLAAIGALAAYSAAGTRTPALAQEIPTTRTRTAASRETQGELPVLRFAIAPATLRDVLAAYERVTGIRISLAHEGIAALSSPGASGILTAEQALQRLLAGTGVTFHFTSAMAATLDFAAVSSSVDVTTSVEALSTSAPKYTEPLRDTPQTISTVSQQTISQQAATTLRDTLRNVAGISLAAGEGGAQGDNLTIRGFSARNDLFIDGMRDFGSYYRDPFNVSEVEVLEGPSSVTFGRGSTGGVVNQATKSPQLSRFVAADVTLGTDLTRRITADFDTPLRRLGAGAAFRLNLMGDEANVAGRDIAENRRFGVAPTLALGLGTSTRWNFGYFHQSADDTPDYGIPWLFNGPAPVNRANYYGFKRGNYLRTNDDIGTARVEHDVNAHVTIRNQVRYANYVRDALITEAQIPSNVTLATPLSAISTTRHEIGVNSVESFLEDQADVTANVKTGRFEHTIAGGVEAGRETSDPTRPNWTNVPTTSLLAPDPSQQLTGSIAPASAVTTTATTQAAYVLETLRLSRQWIVTGGFRWDRFDTHYRQTVAPASAFHRVDETPSWRAALVYKPVENASIYFDAGTSFNPSAESLSLSSATANLPPEKNTTYEFGSKVDVSGGHLSLRAAWFRTEKENAREPDPANPLLNVLAGSQRVSGVQAEVRGRLTNRWEILAGYAYLDNRVVSSKYYPSSIGAPLANVPRNTFNLWTEYRFPWKVELGGGGNYVSSRTASSTAPFDTVTGLLKQIPGYWVFNAMAKRRINERVELQINANNIANRYYYDEPHPAHIVLGPGRSVLAGVHFKF